MSLSVNWSDEARIMLHPFKTYQQLANAPSSGGFWWMCRRLVFAAFILGAFISFTVSGYLTVPLILEGLIFWSFIPILQALLVTGIVVLLARGNMTVPKAIDLFFMGLGPWFLWLLAISGSCLFFPMKQIYFWPDEWGWIFPISLLAVWAWSNVTSFAFLKSALNLSTQRAVTSLLIYTVVLWGTIVSYLWVKKSQRPTST